MPIPEKYVRHIWKNLYLKLHALLLIDGRPLQILSTGKLNSNEGADFLDARIIIDGIEYCGAVEIHSCTSDWLKHHHHLNPRYASIILHVVFEHDQPLQNASPILELRRFLNDDVHKILAQCIKDDAMLHRPHTIACLPTVQHIDDTLKLEWIHALSEQRFQRKVERFASALTDEQYDELIYRGLMRALGYRENTSAFEALAQRVSFSELRFLTAYPFTERRRTLEAIYFSLSALLPSQPADKETAVYVHDLAKRFAETPFHTRPPLDRLAWIFFRLRPQNFPTLRLAGLAEIVSKNLEHGFLHHALEIVCLPIPNQRKILRLEHLFIADAADYWQHHYRFGEPSQKPIRTLVGKTRAAELVINTLLPVLALYAKRHHDSSLSTLILSLYANYPKGLTSKVSERMLHDVLGESYQIKSAAMEQGLLELKEVYCDALRCLECRIGQAIFAL
jgi:hypothetical protein